MIVVKKMVTFIRSPTWITPEFSESLAAEGRETRYSPEQIDRFKTDKKYFLEYRKAVQMTGNSNFAIFYKGSELQEKAFIYFTQMMKQRLNNREDIYSHIIPKFAVGCRRSVQHPITTEFQNLPFDRFTPGSGYLEALVKPNVQVVCNEIKSITPTGIRTVDNEHFDVDAIVCATGFDCSHRPAFPVIGLNGFTLSDAWRDGPRHYLSVSAPGFPNYFGMTGPLFIQPVSFYF
jgi:cation diffusion facilitator CzcD-associated flavoprotein CzcO